MATRTQARESVIGLIYAYDLGNDTIAKHADIIFEDKKIRNKQKDFASGLFQGVMDNIEAIDATLGEHLEKRDINEVGHVEKSILRLAIYEIEYVKLDKAIVINEAIELAKRLASDNAPKFINGLLDSL